ncbi:MAG TPA: hypothetical protein VMU93_10715 [Caulobacteraceae bacterium]|nr:hypothetical protein [Caulobacteraceae bacterium]
MLRILTRVQIAYLCLFFLVCAGMFAFQALHVWPIERCERHGGWWSAKYRMCATPIPIWRITGHGPRPAAKRP